MKFNLLTAAMLLLATAGASAADTDITLTAGGLSAAGLDTATTVSLSISGTMDASDFEYLTDFKALETLDLGDVTVVAYDGPSQIAGHRSTAAGVLPAYALMGCTARDIVLPAAITAIGDHALAGSAVVSVALPATVRSIGASAFAGCFSLTSLTVPDGCSQLGDYLASGCTALTDVAIKGPVGAVPAHAFDGCKSLTSVTMRPSVESFGEYAFNGCRALRALAFPSQLEGIGAHALAYTAIREADMTPCVSLASIGDYAFAGCDALSAVSLPDGLSHIGAGAFMFNTSLTDITLPTYVTVINDLTFAGLSSLEYAGGIINGNIESIGDYGTARWSRVEGANLPGTLTSLGDHAMERWSRLQTLNAEKLHGVPATGADVWDGVDKAAVTLTVSEDQMTLFEEAPQWQDFIIKGVGTSVEIVSDETASDGVTVRAYFNGDDLYVTASEAIDTVMLYDTAGMLLARLDSADTAAVISTAGMSARIFIVSTRTASGAASDIKILKR